MLRSEKARPLARCTNRLHLFSGEAGVVVGDTSANWDQSIREGVTDVLFARRPLEVFGAIVPMIAIKVIDLGASRARPPKRLRNEDMDIPGPSHAIATENDRFAPPRVRCAMEDVADTPAPITRDCRANVANMAEIGDFIPALPFSNRAPAFR